MNFGDKLKELRTNNNMSQAELGKKLHTTGACISSWEIGRTEPNIGQIKAIAELFDINPMNLIGDVEHDFSLSTNEIDLIIEYRNAPEDIRSTVRRLLAYAKRLQQLNELMKGD